jgi:hypothetical protein
MVDKLDFFQYGWDIKNGILSPITATQEPIPYDLRELLDLFCTEKKNALLQNVCVLKKGFSVLQHVNVPNYARIFATKVCPMKVVMKTLLIFKCMLHKLNKINYILQVSSNAKIEK